MICIIAGHFGIASVNRVVYTFHVPLFFVLSGYFCSAKTLGDNSVAKKAKSLFVPYLIGCAGIAVATCVCFILLKLTPELPQRLYRIMFATIFGCGTPHENPITVPQIGALWFLPALFWGWLFLKFALRFNRPLAPLLLLAFCAYESADIIWLPLSIQPGTFAACYMYAGFYIRKHELLKKFGSSTAILLSAVWLYGVYQNYSINIVNLEICGGLLSIAASFAGLFAVLALSKWLDVKGNFAIASFLSVFGQRSLVALLFHAISDFVFPWYLLYDHLTALSVPIFFQHMIVVFLNVLWAVLGIALVEHSGFAKSYLASHDVVPYHR